MAKPDLFNSPQTTYELNAAGKDLSKQLNDTIISVGGGSALPTMPWSNLGSGIQLPGGMTAQGTAGAQAGEIIINIVNDSGVPLSAVQQGQVGNIVVKVLNNTAQNTRAVGAPAN
jgi:hypothetical protein